MRTTCQEVLLQWIPQDNEGLLLGRCDQSSQVSLSSASKALRSSLGQWLVTCHANNVEFLEELGFLYCKLFIQHGGFDTQIWSSVMDDSPFLGRRDANHKGKRYPLDIFWQDEYELRTQSIYQGYSDLFCFRRLVPRFVGAVLVEVFDRLQMASLLKKGAQTEDANELKLLRVLQGLEHAMQKWQAGLKRKDWNHRAQANQECANMICAIPRAEAKRCGLALWYIQLAQVSLLDAVCSSTELFLTIQNDCPAYEPVGRCIEFMNVLATVSHWLKQTVLAKMFESCLQRILFCQVEGDGSGLGPIDCDGVGLSDVLSVLAKVYCLNSFPGKTLWLKHILDSASKMHKRLINSHDMEDVAQDVVKGTVAGNHLDFFPRRGFDKDALLMINRFQCQILDLAVPLAGKSMYNNVPYIVWQAAVVRGFLKAETEHFFPATGRLTFSWEEADPQLLADILQKSQGEIDRRRVGWVKSYLDGIIRCLRENSLPVAAHEPTDYAIFQDSDIEDIRTVCREHPIIQQVLEEFVDEVLELREDTAEANWSMEKWVHSRNDREYPGCAPKTAILHRL